MSLADFASRWGFEGDEAGVLLRAALTHSSAASSPRDNNERLEFLGDALVSAYVARRLFDALPKANEGMLSRARTQIVRRETLAEAARTIGVPDLLAMGNGERKENRHTHDGPLADAYEALVAAVFLSRGDAAAAQFVADTLQQPLRAAVQSPPPPDPKTELQMRLQAAGRGLPLYRTIAETGGGHDRRFTVEAVTPEGGLLGRGEGANKRAAQTEAARDALLCLPVPVK